MDNRIRLWVPEATPEPATSEVLVKSAPILLSGHYRIEVIDTRSNTIDKVYEFDNMITDAGMDAIGEGETLGNPNRLSSLFTWMQLGSGTNPPTGSDTNLQIPLLPRTADNGGFGDTYAFITGSTPYSNAYWRARRTRVFYENEANGIVSEVGFWNRQTGGVLANRTLIRDELGTPVFFTKQDFQQVKITYEWRMYPPTADVVGVLPLKGVNYAYTIRPANWTFNASPWGVVWGPKNMPVQGTMGFLLGLGANWLSTNNVFCSIAGTGSFIDFLSGSVTQGTFSPNLEQSRISGALYIPGTRYRDLEFIFDPGTSAFPEGIRMAYFNPCRASFQDPFPAFQVQFVPNIPKTEDQRLKLVFRQSWQRSGSI